MSANTISIDSEYNEDGQEIPRTELWEND